MRRRRRTRLNMNGPETRTPEDSDRREASETSIGARRAVIGTAALGLLVTGGFVLGAGAAAQPDRRVVPNSTKHFPAWLAGPLHWLGLKASFGVLEAVLIAMCACYLIVVCCAARIGSRRLWLAIVLAHVAAFLAPPVFSTDVFGYIGFARLGVLHGLSPYTHTASAAPHDAIFDYLGWKNVTTPYGPLFTLLTYALVPLGIAGGVWALKSIALLSSLATVALIWRIAKQLGRQPRTAVAFYALNPLVLVFTVAGAHNEALFGMLVAAGALCVLTARERLAGAALAIAAAIKVSASLIMPFALLGAQRRRRLLAALAVSVLVLVALAAATVGTHAGDLPRALLAEQHQVAVQSLPSRVSALLGLGGTPHTARRWRAESAMRSSRSSSLPCWQLCGAPGAAHGGSTATPGQRSRCWQAVPGSNPGTACGPSYRPRSARTAACRRPR